MNHDVITGEEYAEMKDKAEMLGAILGRDPSLRAQVTQSLGLLQEIRERNERTPLLIISGLTLKMIIHTAHGARLNYEECKRRELGEGEIEEAKHCMEFWQRNQEQAVANFLRRLIKCGWEPTKEEQA